MAKTSHGVKFKRGNGDTVPGPETFVLIAGITDGSSPQEQANEIETTSVDDDWVTRIAGVKDGGTVDLALNFLAPNAAQQGLRSDFESGAVRNFQIDFNDHATTPTICAFAAVVTKPPVVSFGTGKAQTANVSLRLSGAPNWTFAPA